MTLLSKANVAAKNTTLHDLVELGASETRPKRPVESEQQFKVGEALSQRIEARES